MDDGDRVELVDVAVFEPRASIRDTVCGWTCSSPSHSGGHCVLRKKEMFFFDSVTNVLALPRVTVMERSALAEWTSGRDLRDSNEHLDCSRLARTPRWKVRIVVQDCW